MGKGIRKYINTSTIALLISVLSLTFTIWFNISRDIELKTEHMSVKYSNVNDYYVKPVILDDTTLLIPIRIACVLSNTGLSTVSVVDYSLKRKSSELWYSDYQVFAENNLPVSINPGSSAEVFIDIMTPFSKKVIDANSIIDSMKFSDFIRMNNDFQGNISMLEAADCVGIIFISSRNNHFR